MKLSADATDLHDHDDDNNNKHNNDVDHHDEIWWWNQLVLADAADAAAGGRSQTRKQIELKPQMLSSHIQLKYNVFHATCINSWKTTTTTAAKNNRESIKRKAKQANSLVGGACSTRKYPNNNFQNVLENF